MALLVAIIVAAAFFFVDSQTSITSGDGYEQDDSGVLARLHIATHEADAVADVVYENVGIYARIDDAARQIAVGEDGWVFVGTRSDKVYALRDTDGDGTADDIRTIAVQLQAPHGVAVYKEDLYIAEIPTIYKVDEINKVLEEEQEIILQPVITGLPTSGHHGLRHIEWGADGMLYVSFGVPCNICEPADNFAAVIRRYALDADAATDRQPSEVYARGVRNSVGFGWHPATGELWFTDNGRDWLGDDLPHDEVNRVTHAGEHFGFPYCHQHDFTDPEYGSAGDCEKYSPPALLTGPHVANLGMAFSRSGRDLFVALHGSWNRSTKIGYALHRATISEDGTTASDYRPFVTGWLQNDEAVLGRPVDVALLPDDSLLVSDDFAGVIYRISPAAQTASKS